MRIYVIGSLANLKIPDIANTLREAGHQVFDDWFSPGPEADVKWNEYEKRRGRRFVEALEGYHATHVLSFDLHHLQAADAVVLVLPAGKSAHLELGWALGQRKKGYILLDKEPERFDVMYGMATRVVETVDQLREELDANRTDPRNDISF